MAGTYTIDVFGSPDRAVLTLPNGKTLTGSVIDGIYAFLFNSITIGPGVTIDLTGPGSLSHGQGSVTIPKPIALLSCMNVTLNGDARNSTRILAKGSAGESGANDQGDAGKGGPGGGDGGTLRFGGAGDGGGTGGGKAGT